MSMTLEPLRQLKDRLRELADRDVPVLNLPETFTRWADIIDAHLAHLAQPAQSVGESMVDRMILEYMRMEPDDVKIMDISTECQETREFCRSLLAAALTEKPAQSVDVRAIPDARPLPELMMASYHEAVGWNAYREALITRAIGNAQSVDVRNVVLKSLGGYLERHWPDNPVSYDDMADKLTAALQEKGNG